MITVFYGFQKAPEVQVVDQTTGWQGWFTHRVQPLLEGGYKSFHLHNPFGLYIIESRIKPNTKTIKMHLDQFEMARCAGYSWLANATEFGRAIRRIYEQGGRVSAYVGSPLAIQPPATLRQLREYIHCKPAGFAPCHTLWWFRLFAALCPCFPRWCDRPLSCSTWKQFVKANVQVLFDAQVDAIGFDHSYEFFPGDCMDQLVREILASGKEVMIEPWPRKDRSYPEVSWIMGEEKFQQVKHRPHSDQAPLENVKNQKIYRIASNYNTCEGQAIFKEIEDYGVVYTNTQDAINSILQDGHIPMVSASQLLYGSLTSNIRPEC
jgi:hypothetical protein